MFRTKIAGKTLSRKLKLNWSQQTGRPNEK
jgi:hypothetical protein